MSYDHVQVIFLFVHVIVTSRMNKLLLSNEAISIAVRDFLKFIIFLGVKLLLTNIILSGIYQINKQTISDMLHKILHQIIFILATRA